MMQKPLCWIATLCLLALTPVFGQDFTATINNKKPLQGETLWLNIKTDMPIKQGTVYLATKKFTVIKKRSSSDGKHHYLCVAGISRYQQPKRYPAKISLLFKNGKRVTKDFSVRVKDAKFRKSEITLTGKKKKLSDNRSQLRNESKIIGNALKTITRRPLFTTPFMWPTKGKFTTPFGAFRSYNGRAGSKHSGTDIANAIGTPVLAANSGKVILSDSFKSHGDIVLIDHGLGIVSIYNHLDKRHVTVGDFVSKGQHIADMGNTGISTGPHLHWGLSVQNVRVNPNAWVDNTKFVP